MNKNKFLDLLSKHKFNVILFILILAAIIFNIVLYYTTHFEKTITIKVSRLNHENSRQIEVQDY